MPNTIKYQFYLNFCLSFFTLLAWSQTEYQIEATLNVEEQSLVVSQTLVFTNISDRPLKKMYLSDWANSYQGTPSPLANHLANQFNRSFYLSAKNKLGYTTIEHLQSNRIELAWTRVEDQLDIIEISLAQALEPNASKKIQINYSVKLPDAKFTGLGINSNNRVFLRDFFISLTPFINNEWIVHSNLGLRDNSHLPSNFEMVWTYPREFVLNSNLKTTAPATENTDGKKTQGWNAKNLSSADFIFDLKNDFQSIALDNDFELVTDILPNKNAEVDLQKSLSKIHRFTQDLLGPLDQKRLLVLKKDYSKNPIVGITEAFSFLNPFSDAFIYETKFLKAYLASYLNELFIINKRKDHWIPGGIQTYVMMKYVETFYPDSKYLGALKDFKILGIRPFKSYSAADIGFVDSFPFMSEFSEHANTQQSDTLGRDKLTKINELYASPYHVGSGIFYLDKYLGENLLPRSILEFSKLRGATPLKSILEKKTNKNIDWFFSNYLSDREAFDLYIKNILKGEKSLFITLSEKKSKAVPYKLDLIKNDSIIDEQWYFHSGKDTIIQINKEKLDYIAINSNRFLPEKNRHNNWKYTKSAHGFKPLKLTFYGDTENLKRNQLFYHPITDYNAYDGFTLGTRIYNTRVKNQPLELDFHPQYSFNEETYVGFFRTRYRFINHKSRNYLNQVFLTGKSYHYNTNLRYTYIIPSFSMYFRPFDLRSNKRQLLNVSWYNVFRDRDPNIEVNPDYSVLRFLHRYSNSDAVNVFSTNSNLELSRKFGKIYFSSQYRKLFPSGRQFAIRFFVGKFLWHNTTNTQFFDFNLNRSTDYLFQYDYIGRSDETGIWSQQFVPAEGGFKAFFDDKSTPNFDESASNNDMTAINASIGIWKWIELYGDVGALKNTNRTVRGYFDSGIKFNLVPDYFEIFFPVYSSNGFEPSQARYATKIRFIFSPRLKTLSSLFTRKWF
jgi:hypothetical protein